MKGVSNFIRNAEWLWMAVAVAVGVLFVTAVVNASTTISSNIQTDGTLSATGATTLSSTLGVTGLTTLANASTTILSTTGNFMVNGFATTTASNGNFATQGTLLVTGLSTLAGASSTVFSANFAELGGTGTTTFTTSGLVGVASTSPWALFSVNPNGISGPAFAVGSSSATNLVVTNGGKVGVASSSPYVALGVVGTTTSSLGATIGAVGSPITQLLFGTCTVNPGAIAASTTVSTSCTATGVRTVDKVFVTPQSLPVSLIFTGASSTANDTIQVSIYNATSTGSNTPSSMTWSWLAIR